MKKKIAVFASGSGSNARRMLEHFKAHPSIEVALIVSNKKHAGVLGIAQSFGVETLLLQRTVFFETEALVPVLQSKGIDFIVLAGFLWLIPAYLVRAFPKRILNIHPALLPKYGGKGMYGMHVHEAVKAAGEIQTGMTIHYVNEKYDEGQIIYQASCPVFKSDTGSDIAKRVLQLEHRHYPEVVEQVLMQKKK